MDLVVLGDGCEKFVFLCVVIRIAYLGVLRSKARMIQKCRPVEAAFAQRIQ
jgi:hypothetical protein